MVKKKTKKNIPESILRKDALICILKGLGQENISLSDLKKYFK